MRKRLLVLSRYDRQGASSRLRSYQYQTALGDAGIDVVQYPLFDRDYVLRLYAQKISYPKVVSYYAQRVAQIMRAGRFDGVWVEKEIFPYWPDWLERRFLPKDTPLIVDYDDAIFHRYDTHHNRLIRGMLGKKIDQIMARAQLVIAGNPYLANRAAAAGAQHIEIIPTAVDTEKYYPASSHPDAATPRPLRLGWIGTPGTWHAYMHPMLSAFDPILNQNGIEFRIVGAGPQPKPRPEYDFRPWSEETEIPYIQGMDIGVMPLADTDWARGKCGYKIIQYMACGLPVIASPVGVNAEIIQHGVNGFLAHTPEEWQKYLKILLADAAMRRDFGQAGRAMVLQKFALEQTAPKLVNHIKDVFA